MGKATGTGSSLSEYCWYRGGTLQPREDRALRDLRHTFLAVYVVESGVYAIAWQRHACFIYLYRSL